LTDADGRCREVVASIITFMFKKVKQLAILNP